MSRINTNVQSLIGQRTLGLQNMSLAKSIERLSTGLRINRGSDDPAGLIASENLRSEKKAITAAIGNAERADQIMNVAEGGLQEVSNLLVELQGLVAASANDAGLSQEEKEANQLQIDSILQTIDRIANSTEFQGVKLLNGNFDFTTSGVNSTLLSDVTVNSAKLPTSSGSYISVSVDVLTSAQTAGLYLSTGTNFDTSGQSFTIEVAGNLGTQQFTFASGTSQADMITAINQFKDVTGVSAAQNGTSAALIEMRSTEFGAKQFVSVKKLDGSDDLTNIIYDALGGTGSNDDKDTGRDATLLINGTQATTDGLKARVSSDGFDVSVTIDGTSAVNTTNGNTSFDITGGGATFNLSPNVNLAGKASIGIEQVTTGNLGDSVDGFLSALKSGGTANVSTADGDIDKAQRIVDSAIKQVSSLRGRIGAFQSNVVGATIRSLGVTFENTAAAESQIRDTDFAAETADLTRSQILVQSATSVLAISNSQPQNVLSLLG
ncbi:MAG: flagellin [Phycisphaerales bacterium]